MKTTIRYFIVTTGMLFCALAPVSASNPAGNYDPFVLGFFDDGQSGFIATIVSPSEQIADILAFFDDSVSAGTLQWEKEGKFQEIMRNMIESTAQSIDQGRFGRAVNQLEKIRNCFYFTNPPQRISGPAMMPMVHMLTTLIQTLQSQ